MCKRDWTISSIRQHMRSIRSSNELNNLDVQTYKCMFKAHLPWVEIFGVTQNYDYSLVGKTKDLDGNARGMSNEWRG